MRDDHRVMAGLEAMAQRRPNIRVVRQPSVGRTGYCRISMDRDLLRTEGAVITYDPDSQEPVLVLAHELGHAWDGFLDPEGEAAYELNLFPVRTTIILDLERRAWDWAELFLRRLGFFGRRGSRRRFARYRDRCLDAYRAWGKTL